MSDKPQRLNSTLPPPEGGEDLYSASTVVGQASAELLALVRAATEDAETKPKAAKPAPAPRATDDAKLNAMKEAAARSAKDAVANEVARQASVRPPVPRASAPPRPAAASPTSTAPTTTAAAPAAPAVTKSSPPAIAPPPAVVPSPPPAPAAASPVKQPSPDLPRLDEPTDGRLEETSKRRGAKGVDTRPPAPTGKPMPPALGIALVFAAAALALAAIVR